MREQHLNEKIQFLAKAYEVAYEYHPASPMSVNINPIELGKTLGFSRDTVERIMNELVSDRYVSSTLGMGSLYIENAGLQFLELVDKNSFHPVIQSPSAKAASSGSTSLRAQHPVVFISYSHDDSEHKKWVLEFADRLRGDGIDVLLDRYELRLGSSLQHFVETSIAKAEKVIVIFTPNYKLKSDKRAGGVGYEYSILNAELYQKQTNSDKIIPVLRSGTMQDSIPAFMQQFIHLDMSRDEDFDQRYVEIIRHIYGEPELQKPKIGVKPDFKTMNTMQQPKVSKTGRRKVTGRIDPIVSQKMGWGGTATTVTLLNGMTMNAGTIRVEDGYAVHYTGKGLREMFKPSMNQEEQKRANELRKMSEEYLEENDYLAWTPLDQIISVIP
ncbi:MAG: toll/interleukin-1 receptor domain-containing protein [Bacteroidia bacterium]